MALSPGTRLGPYEVHDVGRHEGVRYVVSELLDGETLRARLGGSALPARKATEIAVQVARGLAAAHEQCIVRRDVTRLLEVFATQAGSVESRPLGTKGWVGGLVGDEVAVESGATPDRPSRRIQ